MLLVLLGQDSINYLDQGPDTALAVGSCTTAIGESTCKDGKIIVCQCTEPSKQEGCRMVDTGSTCGGESSQPSQPSNNSSSSSTSNSSANASATTTSSSSTDSAPKNTCGSLAVGESTCRDGKIVFCKKDAPECSGDTCVVDSGSTCAAPASPAGGQGGSAQQTSSATCPAGSTNCTAQSQTATGGSASVGDITAGGGEGGDASTGPVTSNPSQNVTTGDTSQTQNTGSTTQTTGSTTQTTGSVTQTANPSQNQTQNANPTITVNVPPQGAAQVRTVTLAQAVAQPRVVKAAAGGVTELPKTGLPELAWAVVSFLPLGLKIRRFRQAQGLTPGVNTDSPNLMLLKRQFFK